MQTGLTTVLSEPAQADEPGETVLSGLHSLTTLTPGVDNSSDNSSDNSLPADNSFLDEIAVLSGGALAEEVTTVTGEEDYGILIQGSDRTYPAIVFRRKHRGKGATIKTISKNGKHAAEYDDFREVIEAYLRRTGKAGG